MKDNNKQSLICVDFMELVMWLRLMGMKENGY